MARLTGEQRAKERSLLWTNLADLAINIALIIVAILSGSLTIFGEALRGNLFTFVDSFAIVVMMRIHRGRFTRYEFGVGKLERLVWMLSGVALIIATALIVERTAAAVFAEGHAASPFGMAMAAVVNSVNLLINTLGLMSMMRASEDRESGVFASQVKQRVVAFLSTLILQVTLTIAALARDPGIALVLDASGAMLCAFITFRGGIQMLSASVPDLLDARSPREVRQAIRDAAIEIFGGEDLKVRTRPSGDVIFAEIRVPTDSDLAPADLQDRVDALHGVLRAKGLPVDLTVVTAREAGRAG